MNKRYNYIFCRLSKIIKPHNLNIIDCACGDTGGLLVFKDIGNKIIGIDINKEKIKNNNVVHEKYSFICSSIVNIPICNSWADIFVCSETLEHLSEKEYTSAIREINRVVKIGGIICITVPENKKYCLSNKFHKIYISARKIEKSFNNCSILDKTVFFKKKAYNRGNLVIFLKKEKLIKRDNDFIGYYIE